MRELVIQVIVEFVFVTHGENSRGIHYLLSVLVLVHIRISLRSAMLRGGAGRAHRCNEVRLGLC